MWSGLRLAPLALVGALAACGGHGQGQATATATAAAETPSPAATAASSSGPAAASATAAASPGGSPAPAATPTPDDNLLAAMNGTIVRSYPAAALQDGSDLARAVEHGPNYATGAQGPYVFVFELPGPAAIASFSADLPQAAPSAAPATVAFATSTTGAAGPFTPAGTIAANATGGVQSLPVSLTARWVQVTANGPAFNAVGATGTLGPVPAGVSPAGIYVELDGNPYKAGGFATTPSDSDPWYRRVAVVGTGMTAMRCFNGHYGDAYPGDFDGRAWSFKHGTDPGKAVVNEDASLIVGQQNGSPLYLLRSTNQPKFCEPFESGTGSQQVLVLDGNGQPSFYPIDNDSLPGYRYTRIGAGMLDAAALADKQIAILNTLCDASLFLSKAQGDALVQWAGAGHKLLIVDADVCSKSDYAFLPYAFTTSNPGAHGASGDRLIVVEPDALGTTDKNDAAHFFEPKTFINNGNNQLGDANIVTTQDAHWCGHLFGTNVLKDNGFMQMYAPYGQGIIIYDGFDHDDSNVPGYQRVRGLEFALPVPVSMPCTQSVALSFLIQPNQEASFSAGTAATINAPMETLANQGWSGHVDVKTSGDFPATVTPSGFDLAGGTQALQVVVNVPASAKPGTYTVTVTGTGSDGKTAQASITLTGTAPLKKAVIAKHQRIRIYGIHFDYDSAHIQPRSEPVIADIAALMKANPAWTFEVSGHTDSDGGAAYNLGLSQRRAQSVVNDLETRYHIARSRLVAKGYGLTRPVATNDTDAGKALNRRVELERLQ